MESPADVDDQLRQFIADLEGTEWSASTSRSSAAAPVCLRIERPSPTPGVMIPQAMEFCRTTLAAAIKSARIHIFKPSS
jgi:hypothetical protein